MGQTSQWIIVILSIQLFMGIIALGIQSIDPSSDLLLGNKLFGTSTSSNDNVVVSSTSDGVYAWNSSTFDNLGSNSNSVLSSGTSIFPDWIRSGWSFMMNAGRTYVNFVGSPYTMVSALGMDPELSALIGAFFGIFGTFIMLNWLLGRDN